MLFDKEFELETSLSCRYTYMLDFEDNGWEIRKENKLNSNKKHLEFEWGPNHSQDPIEAIHLATSSLLKFKNDHTLLDNKSYDAKTDVMQSDRAENWKLKAIFTEKPHSTLASNLNGLIQSMNEAEGFRSVVEISDSLLKSQLIHSTSSPLFKSVGNLTKNVTNFLSFKNLPSNQQIQSIINDVFQQDHPYTFPLQNVFFFFILF